MQYVGQRDIKYLKKTTNLYVSFISYRAFCIAILLKIRSGKLIWTLGYNDFDFLDKMKPLRPEINVKWDSIGHI